MNFYKVWVASPRYHKTTPLTYASREDLSIGEIVEVQLQKFRVFGYVASKTTKPSFAAKEIERSLGISLPEANRNLFVWLLGYYPAPSGQIAQLFLPSNFPSQIPQTNSSSSNKTSRALPPLTKEQQHTIDLITKQKSSNVLLHGNTGTGKTRVYIELVRQQLSDGHSSVILTPEIGLTPQLEQHLRQQFSENVVVTHSNLTPAKRRNIWLMLARSTKPWVVIGPRSALFLPLKNVGLVVVDEAHDSSYKQDQAPHYQATRVAAKLAQLNNGLCVFGTATPLVADYYHLAKRKVPIVRMTQPVTKTVKNPKVLIIDRKNKGAFTTSWLFSDALLDSIKEAKERDLASLIFLNRRGTARLLLCQSCGWQADCPHCDLPLTLHADTHQLRCHTCGYEAKPPLECPECQSSDINFHSAGTKALEQELKKIFPSSRVMRIDSDVNSDERLEKQYARIKEGAFDILIGTQMIAKGLDLKNLGVVGVPFADSSLYLPDFTADEQTYSLLSQVLGRVGRTSNDTKVIIQTYHPKQPVIVAATEKEWDLYYKKQLEERKAFDYPPYAYILQLTTSRKQESTLQRNGNALATKIRQDWHGTTVLGPAPRFHRKMRDEYQWQIIVKAKDRNTLVDIAKNLPAGWRYNLDPTNLL